MSLPSQTAEVVVRPGQSKEEAKTELATPVHTLVVRHLQPEFCSFDAESMRALATTANRVRNEIQEHTPASRPLMTFLLRHDNETVITYRMEDFLQVYGQAKRIDRVQIDVKDYARDANQNKLSLRSAEVHLENATTTGLQTNVISITGESQSWVDGIFSAFQDVVSRTRNKHRFAYRTSVHAAAQITAVLTFTVYSIWLGRAAAPYFKINYAELYAFIVFFLLFSNIWSYAGNVALAFVQKRNPVIELLNKRPSRFVSTVFWTVIFGLVANAVWYLIVFLMHGSK